MTEEEAKTKWCPFARVHNHPLGDAVAGNRMRNKGSPLVECLCLGSACMAWRVKLRDGGGPIPHGHGGFCGLAGAPQ